MITNNNQIKFSEAFSSRICLPAQLGACGAGSRKQRHRFGGIMLLLTLATTSLFPQINYTPDQFKQYAGWSVAGAGLKALFAIDSLFAEKQLLLAKKRLGRRLDAAQNDIAKKRALAQYASAKKIYEPQMKMGRMIAGLAGAAEQGCAVRNNMVEKIGLGSIAIGAPFVPVASYRIGKFVVARSLLTLLDGALGVARTIYYPGIRQMAALTAWQRAVQLTNMMLTHGFKRLSPTVIGLYAAQIAALGLSFFGNPRENQLTNFDWQGYLRNTDQLSKPVGPQSAIADLQKQIQDPTISSSRRAYMKKESARFMQDLIQYSSRPDVVQPTAEVDRYYGCTNADDVKPVVPLPVGKLVELREKVGKGKEKCVVCQERLVHVGKASALPCGHLYHSACVKEQVKKGASSCAQCRQKFDKPVLLVKPAWAKKLFATIGNATVLSADKQPEAIEVGATKGEPTWEEVCKVWHDVRNVTGRFSLPQDSNRPQLSQTSEANELQNILRQYRDLDAQYADLVRLVVLGPLPKEGM